MTKELAYILKNQLHNIQFLDVVAGIVQPVIDVKHTDDSPAAISKKMPVSYDVTGTNNSLLGTERQLVPDKSKKSILYFEDLGSTTDSNGKAGRLTMITSIRLVCWMNKEKMGYSKYEDITARCISEILNRLIKGSCINYGGITRLFVSNPRILIQDAAIFSKYNYTEEVVQYLRPPFEYFAIDLTCKYEARRPCMGGILLPNTLVPIKVPILIRDVPSGAKQTLDNGWIVPAEYPSGITLTVPFLVNYNILQFVLNRTISDGIVDNPIPYDKTTSTWDFHTIPIAQLNDGDEIFIWAALPEKV